MFFVQGYSQNIHFRVWIGEYSEYTTPVVNFHSILQNSSHLVFSLFLENNLAKDHAENINKS